MKLSLKTFFIFFTLVLKTNLMAAPIATFDIGAINWVAGMPNTYSSTESGLTVTATADQTITLGVSAIGVFSGNDNPVIQRNFTYTLPPIPANATSCSASIEFFHLSNNSQGDPESFGNFNPLPDSSTINASHTLDLVANTLVGSLAHNIAWENISTLSWNLDNSPKNISLDIATLGNVSLVGQKNLVIDCLFHAVVSPIPTLNQWALFLLAGILLVIGLINPRRLWKFDN